MYFKDIVGLNDIKKYLINSVNNKCIPHARLFSGPEGVGKLPLAIAYARYLNCLDRRDDDSCGKCSSCIKYDKFAHPDLHFSFPVIKSNICDEYISYWREFLIKNKYFNLYKWLEFINAENNQGFIYAKESDEIIKKLSLKIYEGRYKILIIWLPEKMNVECSNKLLKLIEEPTENTVILLVSDNAQEVLQTIKSRCQLLHISHISEEDIIEAINFKYSIDKDKCSEIAHLSCGNFLNAMDIIESSNDNDYYFSIFQKIMRGGITKNIKSLKEITLELSNIGREKQKEFISFCLKMFREYFINNFSQKEIVYLDEKQKEFGVKFSPYINERNIENFNSEFSLAYNQIEQNGNSKIIFLDLCLKTMLFLKK